jgi:SMC interacting uncharacterized protein involved in chromosome segregation
VFGSRDRGLSSKPLSEDPKPQSDKQFQNAALQKVQNYFLQVEDRDFKMNTPNALRTRSPTLKMFVEMISHLLSNFFPEHIINMSKYANEISLLAKQLGYPGSVQKSWLITANSCHSWPYVAGLLSWMVDLVRCIKHEKFTTIMFSHKDEEEVPENFLDSKTMLSSYFKTYELFKKEDSENTAVEDSRPHQMEKICNVSEKDTMSMSKEVKKLKIQVEAAVIEEEAVQLAVAEQERAVTSFQNDLKKLQNFVQEKYTYLSELEDSTDKWSSKPNRLSECIKSIKADILRMRHTVDNQSITLEDRKQAEQEYRELEESTEMDRACCDAYLKMVYADNLQIAKLRSELRTNDVAHSATLIEYSYKVPELNLSNVSGNPPHKYADQTMQDVLNQLDNIRTQLKTLSKEMENGLGETVKRERRALELKFAGNEECSSAARRVEEIDIAKLKEEIKQEKQRLKQELKRLQDECTRHAEISSTLEEEKHKLKEALDISHTIKDDMLDTSEQVRAHFAELDAMYNDLMKMMMAVNEARAESLQHLFNE